MTASLVYQIHCDTCSAVYPRVHRYMGDVRYHAELDGWKKRLVKDGRDTRCVDTCARCAR